ncbi:MAG: glycosyltransferase family 4 protein [Polyangiaceae bacterium]
MRVLFVTRKYPPKIGGMESLSYALTNGFAKPKTIIALGRSQAHLVWFLPYVIVRVALSAYRYDVVHLGDALLSSAGFLPRLFGKPVAVSVHGLDLTYTPWIYQRYLSLFLRADAFIANSESTKRLAEERGLSPVQAIAIGVPDRYFHVSRAANRDAELERRRAGRVVLVTVGRLRRRKGAVWFVRNVLPQLSGALYVVIGVGVDHEEISSAAVDAGVSDAVWLTGSVSDARLLDLLGSSDVFVMPNIAVSGDIEGFGIVAIEAAASGLPVVASRLEGIPDAVSDGNNGELVSPEDASAYVSVLSALIADPEERERRGTRGRAYTGQNNAWPRIIEQYAALFRGLLRRQRP